MDVCIEGCLAAGVVAELVARALIDPDKGAGPMQAAGGGLGISSVGTPVARGTE